MIRKNGDLFEIKEVLRVKRRGNIRMKEKRAMRLSKVAFE